MGPWLVHVYELVGVLDFMQFWCLKIIDNSQIMLDHLMSTKICGFNTHLTHPSTKPQWFVLFIAMSWIINRLLNHNSKMSGEKTYGEITGNHRNHFKRYWHEFIWLFSLEWLESYDFHCSKCWSQMLKKKNITNHPGSSSGICPWQVEQVGMGWKLDLLGWLFHYRIGSISLVYLPIFTIKSQPNCRSIYNTRIL